MFGGDPRGNHSSLWPECICRIKHIQSTLAPISFASRPKVENLHEEKNNCVHPKFKLSQKITCHKIFILCVKCQLVEKNNPLNSVQAEEVFPSKVKEGGCRGHSEKKKFWLGSQETALPVSLVLFKWELDYSRLHLNVFAWIECMLDCFPGHICIQKGFNQTGPFTILQPQDQEIGEFNSVQERCSTDFEAPKLWTGRLGTAVRRSNVDF